MMETDTIKKTHKIFNHSKEQIENMRLCFNIMECKGFIANEDMLQLSECLPGSYNVLAKALKVSVKDLRVMLRNEKVSYKEAASLFINELSLAYGLG